MKKVFIPGLKLIIYSGSAERKLWEAKDRTTPILKNGDLVILPQNTAALLCRKTDFNICEGFNIFASEKDEEVLVSPRDLKQLPLTDEEIRIFIEEYASSSNLTVTFGTEETIENNDLESKLTPPPPTDNEQEPILDLENILPLEEFETKESLETYGLTFGINLNKTKKLENMYAELLAHIETLKTK